MSTFSLLSRKTGKDIIYDRMYYGTLVDFCNEYPTTSLCFYNSNRKYAPYIIDNIHGYISNCMWEYNNVSTGDTIGGLLFNSLDELASYKNNIVINNGRDFTDKDVFFKPYDEIDSSIPVINKINGVNTVYYSMKGKRSYKKSLPHCGGTKWDKAYSMFLNMFNRYYPELRGALKQYDFEGKAKNIVWTSRNTKNMYNIPANGSVIDLSDRGCLMSGRFIIQENSGALKGLGNDHLNKYKLSDSLLLLYDTDKKSYAIYNMLYPKDRKKALKDLLSKPGYSGVVFFKVIGKEGLAMFVKPLGVDLVYINNFDKTKYNLETVCFNKNNVPTFKTVNKFTRENKVCNEIGIPKAEWLYGDMNLPESVVYFRLRNKLTKRVGGLSCAKIASTCGMCNSPIKWLIV